MARMPVMPRRARVLLVALGVMLLVYAAHTLFSIPNPVRGFWEAVYSCIEFGAAGACLLRAHASERERRAWVLLAAGMLCFAFGDVYYAIVVPSGPSPADAGYLLFYPFTYASLVLLVRSRSDRFAPGIWLEGLIGALAVAAIGSALLEKPIESATGGKPLTVALNLAYPLTDIVLFALVVGVMVLTGRRNAGTWLVAALGFAVFAITDALYLYQLAAGTYVEDTVLDAGWPAAFALLALAAWQRPARVRTSRLVGWQSAVGPGLFGLSGLAVLIYASYEHVYRVAVVLAALSIVTVIARMALLVAQRLRDVDAIGVSEERYRALVKSLPDTVITVFDRRLRLVFADGAGITDDMRRLLALGTYAVDYAPEIDKPIMEAAYREALVGAYSTHELSFPDSSGRTWSVQIGPYRPDGRVVEGAFCIARNVTASKQAEEQLEHQALHDALTGLANRVLFMDRLEQALARLDRHPRPLALLFVDLDHFKVVNDSLGHTAGDEVLVQAAQRLQRALRPIDTVARFGGDEFVILCEDVGGRSEAEEIARRVNTALARPFRIGDHDVVMTASAGIVMALDPVTEAGALLRDADTAMYRAKERGRATHQMFESSMRMRAVQRLELETALRRAIENDELRVLYQPQVRLNDGTIVACEALVRWAQPQRGLVDPADFIPIAEESGLIVPLGEWVFRRVCDDVARLQISIPVSVNVSPRQLADPNFVDMVAGLVREKEVDAGALCLEVTESALFADPDTALLRLSALRSLGLRLAIDDFGIGFSSLYHLRQLPDVDFLKIDRVFIEELGHNRKDSAIVGAVIVLAGSLGMAIVAEGIETQEQADELRAIGADYGQGYLFGRPRELTDLSQLVAAS
jgi:diguanylate cyclase (GGDEF)-like protein